MAFTISKWAVVALIFLGEMIAIYAEMTAAQAHAQQKPWLMIAITSFILIVFAGLLLISGYAFGLESFQNIWIVSATSITSILIVEPVLAWSFFHQLPTKGALIGLLLGGVGLIAATTIK